MFSPHPQNAGRLLIAGSVCWIISGFDFGEPLHAVAWTSAIRCLNVLPSISSSTSRYREVLQGDELPLLENLGELREIPPGIDAVPFGAVTVRLLVGFARVKLPRMCFAGGGEWCAHGLVLGSAFSSAPGRLRAGI